MGESTMFHTYIIGFAGRVDMGRAQFLMDKELLHQAIEWVAANRQQLIDNHNGEEKYVDENQAIWDWYCERHREKYGEPFRPDIDPNWS
jgi:hypothetical protein